MDDLTSKQRLYSIIQQIPKGCVATYGQVAELAGLPGCARMVGRTLSQLPSGSQLPWHRVIAASGKISLPENSDSFIEQKQRLADEGVRVNKNRVNLSARQWQP
jgi:methylated-DNA-protein-cysteine methyltransferase-like protein|tara:strand:- start:2703 stop:3014 length:312 start_codon:yes stop_codon:yes gene_type:complete